jgi:hypothetical protein
MNTHDDFISAIQEKKLVKVLINSKEKGEIQRICVPFDFGPSRRKNLKVNPDRYHFCDLDSPDGSHNLSITTEHLLKLEKLEKKFDPADYISWKPNWFVSRDWGVYS